jgi:hypothetical protein
MSENKELRETLDITEMNKRRAEEHQVMRRSRIWTLQVKLAGEYNLEGEV